MRKKLLIKKMSTKEEDNQTNELIRSILEKQPKRRSNKEIDAVVALLQNNDFFKSKTNLKKEDMKELVAALKFQIIAKGQSVITYGDPGKCMFILLKGQVSVHVPNQMIKDWKQKRLQYAILTNFKASLEANYRYLREQRRKEIDREEQQELEAEQRLQQMLLDARKSFSDLQREAESAQSQSNSRGRAATQQNSNQLSAATSSLVSAKHSSAARSPAADQPEPVAPLDKNQLENLSLQRKSCLFMYQKKRTSILIPGEMDEFEDMRKALGLGMKDIRKLEEWERLNNLNWFSEVARLDSGKSFGELALIDDAPRKATIKTQKECYFAIVEKEDYDKVLAKIEWKNQQ